MAQTAETTTRLPTRVDYPAVARVSTCVQLEDVRVHAATFELHSPPDQIPAAWSGDAFIGFHTEVGSRDSEGLEVNVLFSCVYKAEWKDQVFDDMPPFGDEDPPDIEIHADFALTYSEQTKGEFSEADLAEFARVNGTLHAWPYWRELAETASQRMGIPRLVIGVFKVSSSVDPEPGGDESGGEPPAKDADGTG